MIDSTRSDIDLSQDLSALGKQLSRLKAELPNNPTQPLEFVKQAEIEVQIAEIKSAQVEVGKELLRRDAAAKERAVKRLETLAEEGADTAAELLQKLPDFAARVDLAMTAPGKEYEELLMLSKKVRNINGDLQAGCMPPCCSTSMWLEPNHFHKLLKQAFRQAFGANTSDVFLTKQHDPFDLLAEVAVIQERCIPQNLETTDE